MFARIYKPSKTAMQSGKAKTARWVLEFEAETARRLDPLMGWTSGDEMTSGQVRINFDTREEAVAYAERCGLPFRLDPEHQPKAQPKAYSDNFSFRRRKPWTH
ncbi:MAG: ETC complex I subunit [Parvularcula sp.]|uniref:ETC complex I subunit n=1 Tax=Hyphococcus sp. TaxID=2038636 RepID=UPI000C5F588D|nr:ETC complex I subunit [Parvularcula sp.]